MASPELTPGFMLPGDRRGRVEIIARYKNRPADLAHVDQRAQRHHLSLIVPDLQQIDVLEPGRGICPPPES